MPQGTSVLMVGGEEKIHLNLRNVLSEAGFHVRQAQNCAEARQMLKDFNVPAALFTGMSLPDGTWADILDLAVAGERQVPVIVVSRVVDINLYINVLEYGASDFIVPPFYYQDILHVLKCSTRTDAAALERAA